MPLASRLLKPYRHLPLVACMGVALAAHATHGPAADVSDPTLLPLEQLVETEVITAARFARRISDAPSAVSVMTAEDIRIYGFQSLGQILDHMRGVYLTYSPDYVFLGARGYGGDEVYAGRVLLIIDGVPAADGIFDQIYLGDDSLVDPAMIDRIEYAPGTGSALYGRNAFVGVIHVITKRGRDLQGVQASAGAAQFGERRGRLSAGYRHADGTEWLASVSLGRNDGRSAPEIGDVYADSARATWDRWLLKARHGEWSAQAMAVQRRLTDTDPIGSYRITEANRVATLAHDSQPAPHFTASHRLTLGDYRYHYGSEPGGLYGGGYRGRWWSAETLWTYDGLDGHRLVFGAVFRHDHRQESTDFSREPGFEYDSRLSVRRRSLGLSVEDEFALTDACRGTLGLRVDRRDDHTTRSNPRAALVCDVHDGWTAKLSHGRATRFPSRSDEGFIDPVPLPPESIATTEAVVEGRFQDLRWAGSLYRYRIDHRLYIDPPADRLDGQGAEMELEWQRGGWRVRGSQAWQSLRDGGGLRPTYSPRTVTKLMVSAPLDGERLRLSATVRSLGAYQRTWGPGTPRATLVDVVGLWRPGGGPWEASLGVRNLFDERYPDVEDYFAEPELLVGRRNRTVWLSLTGSFE
jgi:outer membrane receptor protein involved in Fe transport